MPDARRWRIHDGPTFGGYVCTCTYGSAELRPGTNVLTSSDVLARACGLLPGTGNLLPGSAFRLLLSGIRSQTGTQTWFSPPLLVSQ